MPKPAVAEPTDIDVNDVTGIARPSARVRLPNEDRLPLLAEAGRASRDLGAAIAPQPARDTTGL